MPTYKDEAYLRQEYTDKERSLSDLADEHDVTIETIRYWLKKFDIPRRSRGGPSGEDHYAWKGGKVELECEVCGAAFKVKPFRKDTAEVCSRQCHGKRLEDAYSGEGNPQYGVRGEDNATYGRTGEAHPMYGVRGEDNPNYTGGGWRDSADWADARAEAMSRDNGRCVECGLTNTEHVQKYKHELHVHHIEKPEDGGSKYDLANLRTLCASCHHATHNDSD